MDVRQIDDRASVVDIVGELTGESEQSLVDAHQQASAGGARLLVLNFSGLEYMNSTGIGLLVTMLIRAQRQNQRLVAYGLDEHYRQIFSLRGSTRRSASSRPRPMLSRPPEPMRLATRALAFSLFTVSVGLTAYSLVSLVLPGTELIPERPSLVDFLTFSATLVAFPAVGLVVAWRRPENPIGWIFMAIGIAITASIFATEYADRFVYVGADHPAVEVVAWIGTWAWYLASGLALTFAVLLFPDGRLPGRRWIPVAWLAGISMIVLVLGQALKPGWLEGYEGVMANPFGVGGLIGRLASAITDVGFVTILALGFVSISALVIRFRRAHGPVRQQLKWFLYPAGLFVGGLVAASILQTQLAWSVALLGLGAIPVGAGIAILRHRLFDIDVVINRTLVYAALSVLLGALYVSLILAFQTLLSPFTENNAPAVALSTLAVAAVFGPARRRLQEAVDRRFYRSRYDAQRTLDAFAARLRDEVELSSLTGELRVAATRTVQPATVSIWLRERGP